MVQSKALTVDDYLAEASLERAPFLRKLREIARLRFRESGAVCSALCDQDGRAREECRGARRNRSWQGLHPLPQAGENRLGTR